MRSVQRVSTFASGSGPSSGALLRQAVDRSGRAPLGSRENSVKTPLIYTEGKKRKNLTNKMQFVGFLHSWSFVGSGLRPSV